MDGRKLIGGYHISANPVTDGKPGGDVWILFQPNEDLSAASSLLYFIPNRFPSEAKENVTVLSTKVNVLERRQ